MRLNQKALGLNDTHIDQSKVVFINGELLWTNVFLQSRGIGALQREKEQRDKIIKLSVLKSQAKNHLSIIFINTTRTILHKNSTEAGNRD